MRVFVLTGAGVSAESGLRTFRDADGLWEGHDVAAVATPEGFARDPDLVYRFYEERRRGLAAVEPNAAHLALARLEEALGDDFLLVTQNVDDLHDRCGHRRLLHMHGELRKARNARGDAFDWPTPLDAAARCPATGSALRPHVVWFGEVPLHLGEIDDFLHKVDVFCAIGTSGLVWPAAGLAELAWRRGARTVEINPRPTGGPFHEVREGPATREVPRWVDEVLGREPTPQA
ncbi:MAG: NAD-dependent deacylase [Planctomycetota bacterium]